MRRGRYAGGKIDETGRFTYVVRCDDEYTYGDKIERLIEAADERMVEHERTH